MDMSRHALESLIAFGIVAAVFCGLMIWWAITANGEEDQ